MNNKDNDIININLKWFFIVFFVISLIFGILSLLLDKTLNNDLAANYTTEIKPSLVAYEKYYKGFQRGLINYEKNKGVNGSSPLIGDIMFNDSLWSSKSQLYTLSLLKPPYIIAKKANNDTLEIEKKCCKLKFLLKTNKELFEYIRINGYVKYKYTPALEVP